MNGIPIPEVTAMLGHANVNITMTVYVHFIPKMQTDSVAKLAAAIFSGEKPVSDQVDHLKPACIFKKLPAGTPQTITKHSVPQDWVSYPTP